VKSRANLIRSAAAISSATFALLPRFFNPHTIFKIHSTTLNQTPFQNGFFPCVETKRSPAASSATRHRDKEQFTLTSTNVATVTLAALSRPVNNCFLLYPAVDLPASVALSAPFPFSLTRSKRAGYTTYFSPPRKRFLRTFFLKHRLPF
jgi:hypothetical protein